MGFKPTVPAVERVKTVHVLDRATTVIGKRDSHTHINIPGGVHTIYITSCIHQKASWDSSSVTKHDILAVPHIRRLTGFRSGERAGHVMCPPRTAHLCGN
jgi:hypothetical protein